MRARGTRRGDWPDSQGGLPSAPAVGRAVARPGGRFATATSWLDRRQRAMVVLLVLLAALLRAWHLDWMSIWQDEGLSLYRATKDLGFILSGRIDVGAVPTTDLQPPLYFLLLAGWFRLVGVGTWMARWLSLALGLPTIALLWALGRRWGGRRVALVAAALAALSPVYLWYSQEIRSYTLVVTLGLAAVYSLDRALARAGRASGGRRLPWAVASAVANGLLVWTHYLGFLLLVFEALLVIIHLRRRNWALLVPLSLVGLLALPLLPLAVHRLGVGAETDQKFVPLWVMLRDIADGFLLGQTGVLDRGEASLWLAGLEVGAAGLLLVGLAGLWRRRAPAGALVGYLLVPVLALFALTTVKPVYMGVRHILLASPPFYLLLAAGLVQLARRPPLALAASALVAGVMGYADFNFYATPAFRKDELRQLAQYVEAHAVPGDVLAVADPRLVLAYEHLLEWVPVIAVPDLLETGEPDRRPPEAQLRPLLATYRRLWFMTPLPPHRQWLEARAQDGTWRHALHVDQETFPGRTIPVSVDAYQQLPGLQTDDFSSPVVEEGDLGGLRLWTWQVEPRPLVAGRAARVGLTWQVAHAVPDYPDYKVALRLLKDGRDFARGDHEPFHGLYPTSRWPPGKLIYEPHDLLVSPAAPPGTYRLAITVYDPQSGVSYPPEGPLELGTVTVVRPPRPVNPLAVSVGRRLRPALVGGGLALFGFRLPYGQWWPGQRLPLELWWQVRGTPVAATAVRLELVNRRGRVAAAREVPLDQTGQAPVDWQRGDIRRLPVELELPAGGRYSLRLVLLAGSRTLGLRRGPVPLAAAWLGWVEVAAPAPLAELPSMARRLDVPVGEAVLLGHDLELAGARPGQVISVTLYWQARQALAASYRVTVQVVPAGIEPTTGLPVPAGRPVAQHDGLPADGRRPTSGWRQGEVILDRHRLRLPVDLPAGEYLVIAALYDPAAPQGPRLAVEQDGQRQDYVRLGRFSVPVGDREQRPEG